MMTYSEIYYFTGQCLSLDEHPEFRETILKRIQTKTINWEHFVQLCSDHLVIPVIYLKFKAHDLLPLLPEALTQALTEIYALNRERNAQILLQIEDITAALAQENIIPVYLKGTANLLDGLYSDLGERMMGDVDILVPDKNYLTAAQIIEGMGYRHRAVSYLDIGSLKHYPRLHRHGYADIEIHRIPVVEKYSGSLNAGLVFDHQKQVAGKPGLYVPSDAHKVIHTFIHSQLSDKGHAYKQATFRGYYDAFLLSKRLEISQLASLSGYTQKAVSWFVFGQRVLGLPGRFYPIEPRGAKWYCWKYDLALRFPKSYNAYTFIKKLIYLFLVRYAGGMLIAVFQKRQRLSVYHRLKSPEWYGAHLMSFKEYF